MSAALGLWSRNFPASCFVLFLAKKLPGYCPGRDKSLREFNYICNTFQSAAVKSMFGGSHFGCKTQLLEPHFAIFPPRSTAMERKNAFVRTQNLDFLPASERWRAGRFASKAPPPNML